MRQVPKRLIFPAVRFLQQREQANRRQLRLRHLLLLLLRCAAIVLLAAALARPSVKMAGALGSQEAPVAAALIFDTSPRMDYREENRTRLQASEETARWLLTQLPPESDVAVLTSEDPTNEFSVDLGAAEQRVSKLRSAGSATPLAQAINRAIPLLNKKDRPRKEIYIFTDLAAGAWPADPNGQLRNVLGAAGDVGIYVVDVGIAEPRDFALGDVKVTPEVVAKSGQIQIETEAIRLGLDEDRDVALYVLDTKTNPPTPRVRGQKTLHWHAGPPVPIDFTLANEGIGAHQGYVRIMGEDNLAADDVRYFTYEVRPAFRVLVTAPQPAERNAMIFTESLAPVLYRQTGRARFECETIPFDKLPDKNLEAYSAVCLLDPTPLEPAVWQRLKTYVEDGGGLGIWLGRNAQPIESFNDPAALALLPGKLARIAPTAAPISDAEWEKPTLFLSPRSEDLQHPIMARFRRIERTVPWNHFPVLRHWVFNDLGKSVNTVVHYSNGDAALLETVVGKGRVLTWTTPMSVSASDPNAWNTLDIGLPYFTLLNDLALYLVGSGEERLNYAAGDRAVLRLEQDQMQNSFIVANSEQADEGIKITADQKKGALSIPETATAVPGNYSVQSGGTVGGIRRGFSSNIAAAATSLARIKPDELNAILGAGRFRLAHGREEIDRNVSAGRIGRELYPLLIFLVALVLGAEYLLANRFYRRAPLPEFRSRHIEPPPLATAIPPPAPHVETVPAAK
jgi:hypothetical protein